MNNKNNKAPAFTSRIRELSNLCTHTKAAQFLSRSTEQFHRRKWQATQRTGHGVCVRPGSDHLHARDKHSLGYGKGSSCIDHMQAGAVLGCNAVHACAALAARGNRGKGKKSFYRCEHSRLCLHISFRGHAESSVFSCSLLTFPGVPTDLDFDRLSMGLTTEQSRPGTRGARQFNRPYHISALPVYILLLASVGRAIQINLTQGQFSTRHMHENFTEHC
jgi:hypothetical protein